jgi:hypothetical protein
VKALASAAAAVVVVDVEVVVAAVLLLLAMSVVMPAEVEEVMLAALVAAAGVVLPKVAATEVDSVAHQAADTWAAVEVALPAVVDTAAAEAMVEATATHLVPPEILGGKPLECFQHAIPRISFLHPIRYPGRSFLARLGPVLLHFLLSPMVFFMRFILVYCGSARKSGTCSHTPDQHIDSVCFFAVLASPSSTAYPGLWRIFVELTSRSTL